MSQPDPTPTTPALDRAELRRLCEAVWPFTVDGVIREHKTMRTALPALLDALDEAEAERDDFDHQVQQYRARNSEVVKRANADAASCAEFAMRVGMALGRAKAPKMSGAACLTASDRIDWLAAESAALRADVATLEAYRDRLEALLSDIVGEMGGSLPAPIPPEYVREVAFDAIHKIEDERDALRAEVETWRGRVNRLDAILGGATYIEDATRDIAIYRGNRTQWSAAHGKREIGHAKYLTWSAAWSAAEAAQASAERSGEGAK